MGQLIDTGKKSPDLTFIPEDVIEFMRDSINKSHVFWYKLAEMQVEEELKKSSDPTSSSATSTTDNNNTSKGEDYYDND